MSKGIEGLRNKDQLDRLFESWKGSLKTSPADYVRSLESGLPSKERNKRWIVVLQAYIDASGMGGIKKEPHLVLAGFVSTAGIWADFSDAWKAALDKPPSIAYFKSNEAFHARHKSQFKGWKRGDIDNKVRELIKVIKSYKLGRVNSNIDKRDYISLTVKQLPKRLMDNPYWLLFHHLIVSVINKQCRSNYKTSVDFIFDEEGELGYECARWFNYFKKTIIPKWALPCCGNITFGDDERVLPLQAADLYAGLFRRHLFENKAIFMPMSNELKSLQEIPMIHEKQLSLKNLSLYMQREEIKSFLNRKVKDGLTHIV